ncbi:hypothetical protein [Verrucomicrobium sp. BvORR106]|uniref:MuF-C-terminal domain-containing protein n=1 Tax=Verrucomicrobium sp. BvORR106 TaxID=1403819 RepID=UPI0005707EFC|nr:hypothetical protein [Verrucomicrobium sp. BvORR106]
MATDPLEVLADDPNLRRLNRAARLAPDDRTNATINQQREQYIQARVDEQHAAEVGQARAERDAHNDQVESQFAAENRPRYTDSQGYIQPSQPDEVWQAEQQRKQAEEQRKEGLRVAKANGIEIEADPATGLERPKVGQNGKPLYTPAIVGQPQRMATLPFTLKNPDGTTKQEDRAQPDGSPWTVVRARTPDGREFNTPAQDVKWDAATRTHRLKHPESGQEVAIPGERPLTQTDEKTGNISILSTDAATGMLAPQVIGKDERISRSLQFDQRTQEVTGRSQLLQQEHDLKTFEDRPKIEALTEAQKKAKEFDKELFTYANGQPARLFTDSRSGTTTTIPLDDPVQAQQARDWLTKRDAARKQIEELSTPAKQAEEDARARQTELHRLALRKVRLEQAKQAHLRDLDEAQRKGAILPQPDWSKLDADPITKASARATVGEQDPASQTALTDAEQAASNTIVSSIAHALEGYTPQKATQDQQDLAKVMGAFADEEGNIDSSRFGQTLFAGLGLIGKVTGTGGALTAPLRDLGNKAVAFATAAQTFKGLAGNHDLSTGAGRANALKALFPTSNPDALVATSRQVDIAGRPSVLIDLSNPTTGEDLGTYHPDGNFMTVGWETQSKIGTLRAPQLADNGIPAYFGNPNNRLNDGQKRALLQTGLELRLSGENDESTFAKLDQAGLGIGGLRDKLQKGELSYQEARALKSQLYGWDETDLPKAITEDGLTAWLGNNEAYRRMWQAAKKPEAKAEVVTAYFDELYGKSRQTDLAFNVDGLKEARAQMLETLAGKGMGDKARDFGAELAKQTFGSLAAIIYRSVKEAPARLGMWKAADSLTGWDWIKKVSESEDERLVISDEQTADWLRNTNTFFGGTFFDTNGTGYDLRQLFLQLADKAAQTGSLDAISDPEAAELRDRITGLYHADRIGSAEGATRGFTTEAFDVRKDPAIRAALQDYIDSGNADNRERAFRLFALDPKARRLEQRIQAYTLSPRSATAQDVQERAKEVFGLDLSSENSTAILRLASEIEVVGKNEQAIAARVKAAGSLMGIGDQHAAAVVLQRIAGQVTNDPGSWAAYINTLDSAGIQEFGAEGLTTFAGTAFKGLKILRVAAGAAVKSAAKTTASKTLSTAVRMAQQTEKSVAGRLARANRILDETRFGRSWDKVRAALAGPAVRAPFTPALGQTLPAWKRATNVAFAGAGTYSKTAFAEGLEETVAAVGEPGATMDSVAEQTAMGFIYGGLGGPLMSVTFAPLAAASNARQARAQMQSRDQWAQEINAIGAQVPGWQNVTGADFDLYHALMDVGTVAASQQSLETLNTERQTLAEELAAMPESDTSPRRTEINTRLQTIDSERAAHSAAITFAAGNAVGALAAVRNAQQLSTSERAMLTAAAKVAGGRTDFTVEEGKAITSSPEVFEVASTELEGITDEGQQRITNAANVRLTDAGRAQIQATMPELGALISTAESNRLYEEQQSQAQAQTQQPASAPTSTATSVPTAEAAPAAPTWSVRGDNGTLATIHADEAATAEEALRKLQLRLPEGENVDARSLTHPQARATTSNSAPASRERLIRDEIAKAVASYPGLSSTVSVLEGSEGVGASGAAYDYGQDRVLLSIPKLLAETDGFTAEQTASHIAAAVDEEIRHAAHMQAAQTLYELSGDTRPFEEWRADHYGRLWNDEFTEEQRRATLALYGPTLATTEDWEKAFEGIRMLSQAEASGETTEAAKGYRIQPNQQGIIAHLRAVFAYLKDLVSKGLPDSIKQDLVAIEATLKRFRQQDASTAAAPAPTGKPVEQMTQDEYAAHLAAHGPPQGVSFYDALTARPEHRNFTAQERADHYMQHRQAVKAFTQRVSNFWTKLKQSPIAGIVARGVESAWTNFEVGNDSHAKGTDRHKAYATIADVLSLSESDMQGFMEALRYAGFNGQVKFPGMGSRALLSFDNVVMHGATENDAQVAERVAREYFGTRVQGTQFGIDQGGNSHTQALADRTEQAFKSQAKASPKSALEQSVVGTQPQIPEGRTVTLTTPRNETTIQATATAVDISQLVGSGDSRFPGQELQPHDRASTESAVQSVEMMRNLERNPDQWRRYHEGSTTDTGRTLVAPLFGPNGQHQVNDAGKPLFYVISGNGRRNALANLYEAGNPAAYDAGIRAALNADGISTEGMAAPVSVAVYQPSSAADAVKLAEYSNRPAQLSQSTVERAQRDATSIQGNNLMSLWDTGENADPLAASNRDFWKAFARATGEPGMINSDGRPSELAVQRAENAMLAILLNGGSGQLGSSPLKPSAFWSRRYRDVLKKWQDGEDIGTELVRLGPTPAAIRAAGANEHLLVLPGSLFRKATHDVHSVPIAALEQLPESLADPVAIFPSRSRPDSLLVLTEFTEPGKGPIVAAIHLDRTAERGLVVNQIQSLYGRPAGDIAMMFGESPIYENKTKSLSMARLYGLQLPKRGTPPKGFSKILGPDDIVNPQGGSGTFNAAPSERSANQETLRNILERADTLGIRRQISGIVSRAGALIKLASEKPQYNIAPELRASLHTLIRFKEEGGKGTIEEYLQQQDMFASNTAPETAQLAIALGNSTSAKSVRSILDEYLRLADAVDTTTPDIFGEPLPTNATLISRAIDQTLTLPDGRKLETGPRLHTLSAATTAYHGSPHAVDRFTTAKIGTGEGAQVYGWGLYFAERPSVARRYQLVVSANHLIQKMRDAYDENISPFDAVEELLKDETLTEHERGLLAGLADADFLGFDYPHQALREIAKDPNWRDNWDSSPALDAAIERFGNLYEVEFDLGTDSILDWDLPLNQQSEAVQQKLGQGVLANHGMKTGGQYYKELSKKTSPALFSKALSQRGIKAIQYFDQRSRQTDAEERTRNYVIFDDDTVKILSVNGRPSNTLGASPLHQSRLQTAPANSTSSIHEQALRSILQPVPQQIRLIFADFLKDKPVAEIAKGTGLSEIAVQNIVNQMRARYLTALKALQSQALQPETAEFKDAPTSTWQSKIDGGRPDLAGGSIPAIAAIDQTRNTSGNPGKVTLDTMEMTARAMFATDPAGARALVKAWSDNKADLPEGYPVPDSLKPVLAEARASQALHGLMTMAAKIMTFEAAMDAGALSDPAKRIETAQLIMSYRELGTEQARAFAARRDPWKSPAERHAAFLMEGLLSPDPQTRAAYREAETAEARREIMAKWMSRVDDIKRTLLAEGIDIDSILSDYREEQASRKPIDGRYGAEISRADKATRTIVEVLQQGGSPSQAADAAGVTLGVARSKYEALLRAVHNIGVTAAKYARAAMLSAASSQQDPYFFATEAGLHGMHIWDSPNLRPTHTPTSARPRRRRSTPAPTQRDPLGPPIAGGTVEAYEQGTLAIHDPRTMRSIADAIATRRSTAFDKIIEYWKAAILSGPQTQVVNIASNAIFQGYDQWIKRLPEATINSILKRFGAGSPEAPSLSEFGSMVRAFVPALAQASRNALRAFANESQVFMTYARGVTSGTDILGNEWQQMPPAVKGRLGTIMRGISFRLLNTADEFFKSTSGYVELAAAAHRIAKAEGLSGAAYESRVARLVGEHGSEAWQRAGDYATKATFQNKLGSGKRAVDTLDAAGVLLNRLKTERGIKALDFIVPFVQTPANIFKQGLDYSPMGSFLAVIDMLREYNAHRRNKQAYGADVANQMAGEIYNRARMVQDLAQQMVAWSAYFAIRGVLGDHEDDDDLPYLTGSAPWQPGKTGERELGYRTVPAQSIRIGDQWYSYARIEPFASALTTMVDAAKSDDLTTFLSTTVGQLKDKTFLSGISDMMDMIGDPGRYGNKVLARTLTGFIPNLILQPIRNADPVVRDTQPPKDLGFFTELAMRMQFNVLPQTAPPRVDVWGRPVMKNNGDQFNQPATDIPYRILSPVRSGQTDASLPVDRYLLAYNTKFPDSTWAPAPMDKSIQATINGKKVSLRLSDAEWTEMHVQAGQAALKALGSNWDANNPTEEGKRRIQDTLEQFRRLYRDTMKLRHAADFQKTAQSQR